MENFMLPANTTKDENGEHNVNDGIAEDSHLTLAVNQQLLQEDERFKESEGQMAALDVSMQNENLTAVVNYFADAFNGKVVLSANEFSDMLDAIQQHVIVTTSSAIELLDYLCSIGWMRSEKRLEVIGRMNGPTASLKQIMNMTKDFVTIPQ
uniref:Uncharacterized protein n=1 Tax=Trichuris muris TaxID=70415 RepID=A0A5S6QSA9_TRIMR